MKIYFSLIILLFSILSFSQTQERNLHFNLTFNKQAIEIGENYYSATIDDSIRFDAIKFYISDIEFFYDDIFVATLAKKHFLIDATKKESQKVKIPLNPVLKFNKIKFNLGVDSLTNSSGAYGGDLDPTNGMYWTWQSGYINFKLEGTSKICPARNNFFQFHLGGYQAPFNTLQIVILEINQQNEIEINIEIDKFIEQVDLTKTYQVMSPNKQAVQFSKIVSSIFSILMTK